MKKNSKKYKEKTPEELIKYIEEALDLRQSILWGDRMYGDKLKYMFVDVFKHLEKRLDEINKKLDKIAE